MPVSSFPKTCLLLLPWLVLSYAPAAPAVTRTYYLAAEEAVWDYAPSRPGAVPDAGGPIGRRYRKVLFREYTDQSFTLYKARPPEQEHLGLLGPLLRATIGDTLRVVFLNNTRDQTLSLHAQGLQYDKDSEGVGYDDGTSGVDRLDERLTPGTRHTYVWRVPASAGPGPADPSSVLRLYHSRVHARADLQAGLLGPIIISRPFQSHDDARPADIDREFVTLLEVFDEDLSLLAPGNRLGAGTPATGSPARPRRDNRLYTINGYLSGHLPELVARSGDRVRWHVLTLGQGGYTHAPHWHGNNVTAYGSYTDHLGLLPWQVRSVTLHAVNPGTWLFHCLVSDHTERGMAATYTVTGP